MLKEMLFLIVFFMSSVCVANENVCLEQLKLHQQPSNIDLKDVFKMPYADSCRALSFSQVLDEKGDFNWWFVEEEKTIQLMSNKEERVKVYWIVFQRR